MVALAVFGLMVGAGFVVLAAGCWLADREDSTDGRDTKW